MKSQMANFPFVLYFIGEKKLFFPEEEGTKTSVKQTSTEVDEVQLRKGFGYFCRYRTHNRFITSIHPLQMYMFKYTYIDMYFRTNHPSSTSHIKGYFSKYIFQSSRNQVFDTYSQLKRNLELLLSVLCCCDQYFRKKQLYRLMTQQLQEKASS